MDNRVCGGRGVGGMMLAHMVPDFDKMLVLWAGGADQVDAHADIPVRLSGPDQQTAANVGIDEAFR